MFFHKGITERLWLKRERVSLYSITGANAQLSCIRLLPGEATDHRHPEEQLGFIMSGRAEIFIGEERAVCGAGDGYLIPGHVRHGFKVLGDTPVDYIEVFAPPKPENA